MAFIFVVKVSEVQYCGKKVEKRTTKLLRDKLEIILARNIFFEQVEEVAKVQNVADVVSHKGPSRLRLSTASQRQALLQCLQALIYGLKTLVHEKT